MSYFIKTNISNIFQGTFSKTGAYESLFVWLALGGTVFTHIFLIPGVSLADVFFFCCVVLSALYVFIHGVFQIQQWYFYILLFILCSLVSWFLAVSGFSEFSFSDSEFIKSFSKLIFYGVGSLFLSVYINKIDVYRLGESVLNILTFQALVAIYIYVVMSVPLPLPYDFFWVGQDVPIKTAYFGGFEGGFVRARGMFSEPSNFGVFQIMGLSFLYFKTKLLNRFCWKYLLVLFSVLLSFSMASFFLLLVAMLIFYRKRLIGLTFVGVFLFVVIIIFTPMGDVFNATISSRLLSISSGMDNSANARLFASWEIPFQVMSFSPFFGAGLGNLETVFSTTGHNYVYGDILVNNSQGWNILAYVLGTMGVLGVMVIAILLLYLFVRNKSISIVFLFFLFTTGKILAPFFWVIYVLYCKPDRCDLRSV